MGWFKIKLINKLGGYKANFKCPICKKIKVSRIDNGLKAKCCKDCKPLCRSYKTGPRKVIEISGALFVCITHECKTVKKIGVGSIIDNISFDVVQPEPIKNPVKT